MNKETKNLKNSKFKKQRGRKDSGRQTKDDFRANSSSAPRDKTSILRDGSEDSRINGIKCVNSTNDPNWYAASEALMRDAASLPFSESLGNELTLHSYFPNAEAPNWKKVIPGVMAIRFIPGCGISTRFSSPVNVAARNIYSFVTSHQSGAKNYEAPDLMMYLLAMDSIYSFWNFIVRVYGVANLYAQKNRYLPRGILTAMNVDPDDVIKNLSDLRYGINHAVQDIGSRCVPSTIPLIKRHSFMNQYLYLDNPQEKAQIYLYTLEGYHKWIDATDTSPGYLNYESMWTDAETGNPLPLWTVQGLLGELESMIAMVMSSQDFDRMSGDILKAYPGKLIGLQEIPETYTVIPVYDDVVLSQIENSTAMGSPLKEEGPPGTLRNTASIIQVAASNEITYAPYFVAAPQKFFDVVINAHTDETTPAQIMEWTRLITTLDPDYVKGTTIDAAKAQAQYAGTEIVTYYTVVELSADQKTFKKFDHTSFPWYYNSAENVNWIVEMWSRFTTFNRHPMLRIGQPESASTALTDGSWFTQMIADFDNYTSISPRTLSHLHETAILSELAVPLLGAATKTHTGV